MPNKKKATSHKFCFAKYWKENKLRLQRNNNTLQYVNTFVHKEKAFRSVQIQMNRKKNRFVVSLSNNCPRFESFKSFVNKGVNDVWMSECEQCNTTCVYNLCDFNFFIFICDWIFHRSRKYLSRVKILNSDMRIIIWIEFFK